MVKACSKLPVLHTEGKYFETGSEFLMSKRFPAAYFLSIDLAKCKGFSAHASRSFSRLRIRVTRKTSSIVVTPAKTFCAPSWRRFVIPRRIASSWI